jgi:hypothetical protein
MKWFTACIFTAIFYTTSFGQSQPPTPRDLVVVNRTTSISNGDGGSQIIHLDERDGDGVAWITDKAFSQGTIECNLRGKDVLQRSFVGIAFHGVNDTTYEVIYFRPFNFQATDPLRKSHAVQYIALPKYDWFNLRDSFPGRYEKPLDPAPDPNDWFHVKVLVQGGQVSVFVNGKTTPELVVKELVQLTGKKIGYWVGNGSGGDWKDLKLTQ